MPSEDSGIRIQKIIADRGIASRRGAEALIKEGQVTLNGETAELGQKADPRRDRITVNGKMLTMGDLESKITLMMYKPKGFICSNEDPFHTQTVFELLPPSYRKNRLFCAGRLDKDSEGLVILTNDGDLAQRIMHPSFTVVKRYRVEVHKPFDKALTPKLLEGRVIEGEHLRFEKVILGRDLGPKTEKRLEIHLNHGKKREIRRLLESFGYYVNSLHRFQIGRLQLKGIPSGECKQLKNKEIESLFN
ncbi:MAG: pseudouridine synthase [Verrucomicrobiota bacterium]